MNSLPGHPIPESNLGNRHPIPDHLEHSCVTLLHNTQLHQHDDPPQLGDTNATSEKGSAQPVADQGCNTATGVTVAQEPEPRPQSGTHQPEPTCQL